MALPSGADVEIGDVGFLLDQSYERITGRRCYVHGGRSIFAGRTDITGRPGAQNLKEDMLVWSLTRFDGEGQVVLDPADDASQFRFYRSEGLNFRTAGQAKLNKSVISTQVLADNIKTGGTQEGAADFTDISGTSTTSGTDRKLVALTDKVGSNADITYASARTLQLDFYLYRDGYSTGASTIQGNAMTLYTGDGVADGTDFILRVTGGAQTTSLDSGSELTAATVTRAEFYLFLVQPSSGFYSDWVECSVVDTTDPKNEKVLSQRRLRVTNTSAPSAPNITLNWTPAASKSYRLRVKYPNAPSGARIRVDKVMYGPEITENTATIELWNATTPASVTTKTVAVTSQSAGTLVGSISATVGTDNYRARVLRVSGKQPIWVDKVVWNDDNGATGAWVLDCLDLGLGSQSSGVFTPKVWMGAHASGVDTRGFVWNTSTNVWDDASDAGLGLDSSTGSNLTVRAMAHSDAAEYFLLSSNEIVSCTAAGVDTLRATNIPNGVGMCVAQERLWTLSEGTDVIIYSIPLEASAVNVTSDATVRRATVLSGTKTPDTSLRQRMCGTPTGARFFLNFGDVSAAVYETDGSGTTLATRQIADLGTGVKATSIAYESGITFVGAQYYGDATASDSDKKPRAVLFAIDQNGVVNRIGFFRRDSPDVRPPVFLVPYQTDLYCLQGKYVWRYSLVTGGLFLEYELDPKTAGNARSLAVVFGRTFAAYDDEAFVSGSVGTYRQSSVTGGNTYVSSVYDFGLPAVRKALTRIDITTDTLASNTMVAVEYQVDQNGTWTLAGMHTAGTNQSYYVTETTFATLQIRATLTTVDGVSSPVLRGITVWASSSEDEEYFDLVLLTEDQDSSFRLPDEQVAGGEKSAHLVNLWRRKEVTTFRDGYATQESGSEDYLVTIEDIRVEQNTLGEGRTVVTLRVIR